MEESLDQLSAILPIDFFQITIDAHLYDSKEKWKEEHRLPDFSELLFDPLFATVSMGVAHKGLHFHVAFLQTFTDCQFPDFRKGDSVELFIDTRDLKSAGFLTKFCHHFVFLPQKIDGVKAHEVTAFWTDDRHELCDPNLLKVESIFKKKSYEMEIEIPATCLEGYDPKNFNRMGFTYRINRQGGDPQHFALSSDYLVVEKESNRWSTVNL
jgi:hypothetical protein